MDWIPYVLKVNLAFAMLLAGYWFALRRETWFAARRAWILLAAILSLLLPVLPASSTGVGTFSVALPTFELHGGAPGNVQGSLIMYLVTAHVAVSLILLMRLLLRSYAAIRSMRSPVQDACSFFGSVRLPMQVHGQDADAMRRHELLHARQLHSLDVILFEVFAALWWTNPLWRVALRELRLVHEHAADAVAKDHHEHYDRLLLAQAMGTEQHTLLHLFSSSNLKTRIAMLYNTRSPRNARPKLLLAMPVLLLTTLLVSWQAVPVRMNATDKASVAHVDQQPEFPGGTEALMKFLGENIKYPAAAKEEGVEGTVYVGFIVDADGTVGKTSVKRGVHEALDAEALRVVGSMPKWKPGMAHGKAVEVEMVLPINFQLESKE